MTQQPILTIRLIVLFQFLYYGTALLFAGLPFHVPWMQSFFYTVLKSEHFLPFLLHPVKDVGLDKSTIIFIFYLLGILIAAFFLTKRKAWARKVILIQHGLRSLMFLLGITVGISGFFLAASDPATAKHLGPSLEFPRSTWLFLVVYDIILWLPSFLIWSFLRRPNIKKEYAA